MVAARELRMVRARRELDKVAESAHVRQSPNVGLGTELGLRLGLRLDFAMGLGMG